MQRQPKIALVLALAALTHPNSRHRLAIRAIGPPVLTFPAFVRAPKLPPKSSSKPRSPIKKSGSAFKAVAMYPY